jgi:hypothetical protein
MHEFWRTVCGKIYNLTYSAFVGVSYWIKLQFSLNAGYPLYPIYLSTSSVVIFRNSFSWVNNKILFLLFVVFITNNKLKSNVTTVFITRVSFYIIYIPTCFDISMSSSETFTIVPCQVTYILNIEAVNIKIP